MESTYTIPIIKDKQINLGAKEDGGLGLEGVSFNYHSSSTGDKATNFNLLEKRVTIDEITSIQSMQFDGCEPQHNFSIPPGTKVTFTFAGMGDYTSVKLSDNETTYNIIEISIVGAVVGNENLTLDLKDEENNLLRRTTIEPGETYGQLSIAGLSLSPEVLSFEASGSLLVDDGETTVEIQLNPMPLEIEAFTIKEDSFNTINDFISTEPIEIGEFQVPFGDEEVKLELKTAEIKLKTIKIPENLTIGAKLVIGLLDDNGAEVQRHESEINLKKDEEAFLDLKNALNELLNSNNARTIRIRIDEIAPRAEGGDVTITYPGEIRLENEVDLVIGKLTYTSSFEGPEGAMGVPEELPTEVKEADIFFTVKNTSSMALTLGIWLSPNPIDPKNPDADPKVVKNTLTIKANNEDTSVLRLEADEFSRLAESKTIYHLIKIINDTKSHDEIGQDDYLGITSWARVTCIVNKREERGY